MPPPTILADHVREFRKLKNIAERAIAQVTDEDLSQTLDEESNSIALLVKHLTGNLRSRWTNFLTSDGEKPDRGRDSEFVADPEDTRQKLLEGWEGGWRCLFEAIDSLTPDDLPKIVTIRSEPFTVTQAILRQMTHCAYHIGQIVFLAKYFAGGKWQTLTIPRGQSEQYRTKPYKPR